MDYILVQEYTAHALVENVNGWIAQGYIPVGGVSVVLESADGETPMYLYTQAMMKKEGR